MKKPANVKSFLLLILLSVIIVIVASGITMTGKSSITPNTPHETSQNKNGSNLKTFKSSETLKFSISLPSNFVVEEKLGRVTISSNLGTIYVDRNGTNFNNLNDYLNDLDNQNKGSILEDQPKTINNYKARIRLTKNKKNEINKTIIIFTNGWIFNIFTNSEALYPDLDQIAQSFRYTPNAILTNRFPLEFILGRFPHSRE